LQEARASNRAEHQVDAGRDACVAVDIADLVLCRGRADSYHEERNPHRKRITRGGAQ